MKVIRKKDNKRVVECIIKKVIDQGFGEFIYNIIIYKVQIKVLFFWVTIKTFDEDDENDALECYKYITNPYKLD